MAFVPCNHARGTYASLRYRIGPHDGMTPNVQATPLPPRLASLPPTALTTAAGASVIGTPEFLLGVLFGGILCSAALSVFWAFGALGQENVSRAWVMARSVMRRVWIKFTSGLNRAWRTLVKYRRWRFRKAWKVLIQQLALTRKTAVDGIEAIKLEASLYSGVVGKLGFPLAQYVVDNLSPKLGAFLAKENLLKALRNIQNKKIRRITLEQFDFGTRGPTLISARTYDLKDDSAMAIDVDLEWDSEITATLKVVPRLFGINKRSSLVAVPGTLKNCRFEGVVRVILTPLTDEPPGFGAALISFPKTPSIGLDLTVSSVDITKTLPWLKADLLKEIQSAIANEFLWPKRIIVPSGIMPKPPRPVLARSELEELSKSDPLLRAEERIDANVLIQTYELTRDVADVQELVDNMDVFIGDEAERIRQLNRTDAINGAGKNVRPRLRFEGMDGLRFDNLPWMNRNGTKSNSVSNNDTDSGKGFSFRIDLPWQNNSHGNEKSGAR